MDFDIFLQSGVGNGNPPYDLAYPGLPKEPIFTFSDNILQKRANIRMNMLKGDKAILTSQV